MFKKIMSMSLAATMVAGLGIGIASCGDSNTLRKDNAILVQVEKDWMPLYESVKKSLEENEEYKKLGISINFKETGSFDEMDLIDNKGTTDSDGAEVFAVSKDRYSSMVQNGHLKEIDNSDKFSNTFYTEESKNYNEIDAYKFDNKLYGVPYSIESIINFTTDDNWVDLDSTEKLYTSIKDKKFSLVGQDLYFAYSLFAGLDDSQEDAVFYEKDGKFASVLSDKTKITPVLEALYSQLQDSSTKQNISGTEAYNNIKNWLLSAKDRTITTGPWEKNSLLEIFEEKKADIEGLTLSVKPLNTSQKFFKGGWGLSLAKTLSGNKYEAAKMFIEEISSEKHIEEMYEHASKISAHKNTKTTLENKYSDQTKFERQIVDATYTSYENNVVRGKFKENDSNFWEVYKNVLNLPNIASADELATKIAESYTAKLASLN